MGLAVALATLATLASCDAGTTITAPTPLATPDLPAHVNGLFAVDSVTLGPIVIDGQGFLAYRSDSDTPHPSTSTCLANCTRTWLPLRFAPDLRVTGIDRQLIGNFTRPDGIVQLTLAGWPLYGYAGDRMPGDSIGQGADGTWFAITPDGKKAGHIVPKT
jgi:predicted lipoprotein with Yx(FWY)xxD motif